MRKLFKIWHIFLLLPLMLKAEASSPALFIKNEGQWENSFLYKLRLNNGAMFFQHNGYTMVFSEPGNTGHSHSHTPASKSKTEPEPSENYRIQSIKVSFLQANPLPGIYGNQRAPFYHNYFLGNDPSRWKSEVDIYQGLSYRDVYPGIGINFKGHNGNLKYDFVIAPGADPGLIRMKYEGARSLEINKEKLLIHTVFGGLGEIIPEAYQIIDGEKIKISCFYQLNGNVVSFKLKDYDPRYELIIDPELIFSTFTGSSSDNWGFTATYDHEGNLYAGGVVFNRGSSYPVTPGAFQTDFQGAQGDVDLGISKFSQTGDTLLYSTFVGGSFVELPHSLVVDDNNNLYILGATSSDDFPVTSQAYQSNMITGAKLQSFYFAFENGSDLFISKLNTTGTSMLSSTYFGGNGNEGVNNDQNQNTGIYKNYGDDSRGEIIVSNSSVFIISNTSSDSLPLKNAFKDTLSGKQDALIASFNSDLSDVNWATYYGGTQNDAGYSIKADGLGSVFVGGSSYSNDLPVGPNGVINTYIGNLDGYLAKFDEITGAFLTGTYVGNTNEDQVYLLDIDRNAQVYCFGQAKGGVNQTPGIYSNPSSWQFIKKYNNGLTTEIWSTQIGSGQSKYDLVPTAFLVDDCFNIYLSGWNGESNEISPFGGPEGNTQGLPVTNDAYQSSTDGSDFYFMVLGRDAGDLVYGSFFGGTAHEHVDGGTSRFDPSGTIFQAVCAGCSGLGFPTTPGVVSETNGSSNCNLGAIKIDFEASVRSRPALDIAADVDTLCDTLFVKFSNNSINAQQFLWDFGNGRTSTEEEPSTFFSSFGIYEIRLIAIDTNCQISDTSYISLTHDIGQEPQARFTANYIGCDSEFEVSLENLSRNSDSYLWDFGDGVQSTFREPVHHYNNYGEYIITLTAIDGVCQKSHIVTDTVVFLDTTVAPQPVADISRCGDGSVDISLINDRARYNYSWSFGNSITSNLRKPNYHYDEPGEYTITVTVEDTLCNKIFRLEYPIVIDKISRETFIPNAFSPNGDRTNEKFKIFGNSCDDNSEIKIFNRWGQLVFYSQKPFEEFWDATTQNGKPAPEGVYTYSLKNGDDLLKGAIILFR